MRDLDLTEAALARERLYFLVGAAWCPPEGCLFRIMPALLRGVRSGAQTLGWTALLGRLRALEAWRERVAGDIAVEAQAFLEYRRPFAGWALLVPLLEECYGSRPADAAELADVRHVLPQGCPLGRLDAEVAGPSSPPAELNPMGRLCVVEWQARCRADWPRALAAVARQHMYLGQHLARWVPLVRSVIESTTRSPLYLGLGRLSADVVAKDRAYLAGLGRPLERRIPGPRVDG